MLIDIVKALMLKRLVSYFNKYRSNFQKISFSKYVNIFYSCFYVWYFFLFALSISYYQFLFLFVNFLDVVNCVCKNFFVKLFVIFYCEYAQLSWYKYFFLKFSDWVSSDWNVIYFILSIECTTSINKYYWNCVVIVLKIVDNNSVILLDIVKKFEHCFDNFDCYN